VRRSDTEKDKWFAVKVVAFAVPGSLPHLGVLCPDLRVVDLATAAECSGLGDPAVIASARSLLAAGSRGLDAAETLVTWALNDADYAPTPLAELRLTPPIPDPDHLVGIAGNYGDHIVEGGGHIDVISGARPRFFLKPQSGIIGPGEAIRVPALASDTVDYEAELGAVIGRDCRLVDVDQAMSYVAGYVNVNDVSARAMQDENHHSRADGWGPFFGWLEGKSFDTFAPIGPYLVLGEVDDPMSLSIQTRVNGELRQNGTTAEMIIDVARLVSGISQIFTLRPGDVIATGTPAGVADATGRYLRPGDTVEVEVEGLGVLSNPVVA
jgi:2-keto-4-pentenoate hydratase/2-oxohepta-3-ene-1,7-dioic acid hydratase in catechol pathway